MRWRLRMAGESSHRGSLGIVGSPRIRCGGMGRGAKGFGSVTQLSTVNCERLGNSRAIPRD